MKIIDISPPVQPGTQVWPGDTDFTISPTWSIDAGDSVTVSSVTTTTHIGAHIDAPSHVTADGAAVHDTPLDACIGPCLVLNVSGAVDRSTHPHTSPGLDQVLARVEQLGYSGERIERLLLRHSLGGGDAWDPHMPGVAAKVVSWFAQQGGRLIGIDLASFDPAESKALDAHREAIGRGVVLLEGLDLTRAPEGQAELIALPLPWVGADASPVRAVLRVTDSLNRTPNQQRSSMPSRGE